MPDQEIDRIIQWYNDQHKQLFVKIGGISPEEWKYHCFECSHLHKDYRTCPAFPQGIPEDIIAGKRIHKKIHPQQTGDTLFQALPDEDIECRIEEMRTTAVLRHLAEEIDRTNKRISHSPDPAGEYRYKNGLVFAVLKICQVFHFPLLDDELDPIDTDDYIPDNNF